MITDTVKYRGRKKLTASYKPSDMNEETVKNVLLDVLPEHSQNAEQMLALKRYYLGEQDILLKEKLVRPEINHKIVENYAYMIVEFKTNYIHGNPLSYVKSDDANIEEVEKLNAYMFRLGKQSLDKSLGQDRYTFGTGYRVVLPKNSDVPFEIYNLNPMTTGCVYSTSFRGEKLFAFTYVNKKDYEKKEWYREISVYTNNRFFVYKTPSYKDDVPINYGHLELELVESKGHAIGRIPIIEYELNDHRFGLVELTKSQQDALNHITSNELDDLDQFVQSLLVITNGKLSENGRKALSENGGVFEITSSNQYPSKVELLFQTGDHTQLKVLHDRIHRSMMTIAGVPIMSDKNSSGGDTGQARLVGEGWTMADERAKSDEFTFESGEKELLDIILSICHRKGDLGTLKNENLQVKFNRNRSDNLQTKVQALQGLMSTGIVAPDDALRTSELFQDYIEVYQKGQTYKFEKRDFDIETLALQQQELNKFRNQEEENIKQEVETDQKKQKENNGAS